jgi:membrane protease YdiL (CAAX protease family)
VGVTGTGAGVDVARRGRAGGNPYGFSWALAGIAAGFVCSAGAVGAYMAARGFRHGAGGFGGELIDLVGLWLGFAGAAVLAVWSHPPAGPFRLRPALAEAYGFSLRLWPDVPLGVACGVAAQYLLVPALEWPLSPFVPHLYHRIAEPANSLVAHVHGPGLVVLGLFICLGSPIVEELYFRGLLLRSLIGGWGRRLARAAVPLAVVAVGLVFGLVHFEALEFPALAGFGVLLGILAARTGRLGAGICAHVAFNVTAFFTLATVHL